LHKVAFTDELCAIGDTFLHKVVPPDVHPALSPSIEALCANFSIFIQDSGAGNMGWEGLWKVVVEPLMAFLYGWRSKSIQEVSLKWIGGATVLGQVLQ